MSKYGVISGPYFPVFGLSIEIYFINLCIQSKYRKIGTRKTPHLDTFYAVEINAALRKDDEINREYLLKTEKFTYLNMDLNMDYNFTTKQINRDFWGKTKLCKHPP